MRIYLSHSSAVDYWRIQRVLGSLRPDYSAARFLPALPSDRFAWDDLLESAALLGLPRPVNLLIREGQAHRCNQSFRLHRLTGNPPPRGFARVSKEVFVALPEYAFMQVASGLTVGHLAALGFEMCGMYATRPWMDEQATSYQREPFTSPARIRAFVDGHPGITGAKKARRISALVKAHAGSPMETALALLLCLPVRMGGYGLPWPELNKRVLVVDGRGAPRFRYCDLCWNGYALEYEGAPYHAQPAKQAADSARRVDLGLQRVDVDTVFRSQVEDPLAFEKVARVTARHIGWRLRPEALIPSRARWELRRDLLG